jgi:hypothetical protein
VAELLPHNARQQQVSRSGKSSLQAIELIWIRRFTNAHETTAVEAFAIALQCGDVRADVSIRPITTQLIQS